MINVNPTSNSTEVIDDRTWRPHSLKGLMEEISVVQNSADTDRNGDRVLLYRGHANSEWVLNSTYARSLLSERNELDFETAAKLFLNTFGSVRHPSAELDQAARDHPGIDPWFELMKRMQQHPEEFEQIHPFGTFFLDWSKWVDVGLCFACEHLERQGCFYVFDAESAGSILIQKSLIEVLKNFRDSVDNNKRHGRPLMFCPPKQIEYQRALRQDPVYVAQLDLTVPLELAWEACEVADGKQKIFHKFLIPPHVKSELFEALNRKGMTLDWLLAH